MNEKQRLVLFFVMMTGLVIGTEFVLDALGLVPRQPPPQAGQAVAKGRQLQAKPEPARPQGKEQPTAQVAKGQPDQGQERGKGGKEGKADAKRPRKTVELALPRDLALGSTDPKRGYRLAVQLAQRGGGVAWVASSRYLAEFVEGKKRNRPLEFIEPDRHVPATAPPSFAVSLISLGGQGVGEAAGADGSKPLTVDEALARAGEPGPVSQDAALALEGALKLDYQLWDVVRDPQGRAVWPVTKIDPATKAKVEGQEAAFRIEVGQPALTITKRFRLWKGENGFELALEFDSPSVERSVTYQLLGPHGIPVEGEWYTNTFRDVFFSQLGVEIKTRTALDVAKTQDNPKPLSASPLLYAGVENQYFAVFLEPDPRPTSHADSHIAETVAAVVSDDPQKPQKADVSVKITSKPVEVGPNRPVVHRYRVYAGPKRSSELAAYNAEELASYRKYQWFGIPGASYLARHVIAPLLDRIYALTRVVAGWFGGTRGSYGIAIILLTITVRLLMFPLSRKQAISAQKMQELQPYLVELKEKYKDDKEAMTRETFALYRKHGVNPMGGCLPALIQLPIFVGLWQALNNSVELRHAPFLWIENLAAPDMAFKLPFTIPLLGTEYVNLLPFLVVGLMLVQTKLFSPPATTPEMEQQQLVMKIMMVMMAFLFYSVPSGLGIYFITSSLWAVGERLLLPKLTAQAHVAPGGAAGKEGAAPPRGEAGPAPAGGKGNGAPQSWLARKLEKLLQEAAADRTIRNAEASRERDKGRPQNRPGRRR